MNSSDNQRRRRPSLLSQAQEKLADLTSAKKAPSSANKNDPALMEQPRAILNVHPAPDLVCQICHKSHMRCIWDKLREPQIDKDEIFKIMPCGHVAGSRCLTLHMMAYVWCPFCKHPLVYKKCGHKLRPWKILNTTVWDIPKTIPMGGSVPDLCPQCVAGRHSKKRAELHKELLSTLLGSSDSSVRKASSRDGKQVKLDGEEVTQLARSMMATEKQRGGKGTMSGLERTLDKLDKLEAAWQREVEENRW